MYFRTRPHERLYAGESVYIVNDPDIGDFDCFRYGGYYWVFRDGYWYRSTSWRGHFMVIAPNYVPAVFYRMPPARWKHRPSGPPVRMMQPLRGPAPRMPQGGRGPHALMAPPDHGPAGHMGQPHRGPMDRMQQQRGQPPAQPAPYAGRPPERGNGGRGAAHERGQQDGRDHGQSGDHGRK
jgi:hypothetical protein